MDYFKNNYMSAEDVTMINSVMLHHQKKPLTRCRVGQQDVPHLIVFQVDLTALNTKERQLSMCALIGVHVAKRNSKAAQFTFFSAASCEDPNRMYASSKTLTKSLQWRF